MSPITSARTSLAFDPLITSLAWASNKMSGCKYSYAPSSQRCKDWSLNCRRIRLPRIINRKERTVCLEVEGSIVELELALFDLHSHTPIKQGQQTSRICGVSWFRILVKTSHWSDKISIISLDPWRLGSTFQHIVKLLHTKHHCVEKNSQTHGKCSE